VFADVSGFTALARRLDPEELTDAMNRCFHVLEEVVTSHGGHVDKYIGDCIMALFGVPQALEDAARQAVNASIEMRNRIARFNDEQHLPERVDVHIGINTGLVIAGDVGGQQKRDFTVMGDTVNIAARLKDAAKLGEIWVGATTWSETRFDFEHEKLPPLTVKNVEVPLQAYRVRSTRVRMHRATMPERRLLSGMVGRERELATLRERVAALADGRGGIVSVVGEAGIGKSRLMAELLASEEIRATTVLQGRSVTIGENLSFHPFVDLLRTWADVPEEAADEAALGRLDSAVDSVAPRQAPELVPFLARVMGLPLTGVRAERLAGIDAEGLEKLIAKAVRDLCLALASVRPLVLWFEDLHWADQSSLRLLLTLLPIVRDARVLVLLSFRPDYRQTSQAVLGAVRSRYADCHVELSLAALDSKQCALLLQNLIRFDDRPHTTRALLARAEGNPFFIEEVIRALVDEGAIVATEHGYRVTDKIDTVVVPSTVQDVIMARADRLPPNVRQVLDLAAVIGPSFPHRVLAAVSAEALDVALAHLDRAKLLTARWTGGEPVYTFVHAIAQNTIYESILRARRKELHQKIANAIETEYADRLGEFAGMLAYHYGRTENVAKAGEYLLRAGDEAARAAASSEALTYFQEAARLYLQVHGEGGDPLVKTQLEKRIGNALLARGDLPGALIHYDRALALLGEDEPTTTRQIATRAARDLAALLAHVYLRRGRPSRRAPTPADCEELEIRYYKAKVQSTSAPQSYVVSTFRSIRRLSQVNPAGIEQACGMYAAAGALFAWSGVSFDVARRLLTVAETLVRNVRDDISYRSMRFLHHYLQGDWSETYEIAPADLEQGLRFGTFWEANTYLGLACEERIHRGDMAGAREHIARIAHIGDEYGYDFVRTNERAMMAFLLLEQRRLPEALDAVASYYAIVHEEALNLLALATRARVLALAGQSDAARTAVAEAGENERRLGRQVAPYHVSALHMARFLIDVDAVEHAAATGGDARGLARVAARSQKLALGAARRIARERPEAYRLAGRLAMLSGDAKGARTWWTKAIDEAERLGTRPELARALIELGTAAGAKPDAFRTVDAAVVLARGRAMLLDMQLTWDLERTEQRAA
jgi:class 3 adenylate cyclase/tetratricopeptide (TPR) repeat protein